MSGFQFIQFEGPDDIAKSEKRKYIRAYVMKKFHRQRRINRVLQQQEAHMKSRDAPPLVRVLAPASQPNTDVAPQPPSPTNDEETNSAKPQPASFITRKGAKWAEYSIEWPGDATGSVRYIPDYGSDAATFILGCSPSPGSDSQILSQRPYTHVFISQHVAHVEAGYSTLLNSHRESPLKSRWLPASMMHPMLFHSSLFVCSASLETLSQVPLSTTSYSHRGKAIALINNALSDPIQQKSDEIVAAILSLANFECVIGNIAALRNHLDGLLELAELRGGSDQLGMDGLLSKLIQLYVWFLDVFSPHRMEKSKYTSQTISCLEVPTFYQLFTLLACDNDTLSDDLSSISILRRIYDSIIVRDKVDLLNNSATPSDDSFHKARSLGCFTVANSSQSTITDSMYESCRLAYIIWACGGNYLNKSCLSMLNDLKDTLEKVNMSDYWLPFPGALLWYLLVGVDRTFGDDILYPWFVSQLLRFWVPLSLQRWRGLQRSLSCFGWLLKRGRHKATWNMADK
ncbi:hypothetical protein B7463_g3197, partial [Scytalidium lignicola]